MNILTSALLWVVMAMNFVEAQIPCSLSIGHILFSRDSLADHEPAMGASGGVRLLRTALLLLVLSPAVACAQATEGDGGDSGLRITGVRPLTAEPAPFPMVEPFLAVNPRDPENLLVSVMSGSGEASAVYASWDGGESWQRVESPDGSNFPGGDPLLVFDGNGRAYFSTIPTFHLWRSTDGGRNWTAPVDVGQEGRNYDRPWIAASPEPSDTTLVLHAVAKTGVQGEDHLFISVSRDGGASFEEGRLVLPDSGYLQNSTDLVVRADGTVLLPYLVFYGPGRDGRGPLGPRLRGRYHLLRSDDVGATWSGPYPVGATTDFGNRGDPVDMLRGLAAPGLAVDDTGGPFGGSAYMVWPTIMGDHLQIVAVRSRDGGRNWSQPVRVNRGGFDSHHGTPSIAVNGDGVVAVTWNDRRHDPRDACFRHWIAVSRDGGRTFGPGQRISDQETCPEFGSRWMNGGETQGLAALPDGGFRVVWTVGQGRTLRLWTAVIHPE